MDNRFHEDRAGDKFETAILNEFGKIDMLKLRKAIKETADDISVIIDNLTQDNIINTDSVYVAGISMGGFAVFRAIVSDKRITSAATIIASPYWDDIPGEMPVENNKLTELQQYSDEFQPAAYVERIFPTSLLIQYAKGDPHYKAEKIRDFYNSLKNYYSEYPEKICLKEYDINQHVYTDEMLANVADWFSNK